jgi:hypothetical protein
MAKEFWKYRKGVNMDKHKDEIFVYFIIKFQFTTMKMALEVLKRDPQHKYLFDAAEYKKFIPSEALIDEIKKTYSEHEKYYMTIKKSMKSKDVYKMIEER